MRFFLALWVVLHHLTGKRMMLEAWAAGLPEPIYNLVRGGYLAVGTFFVLSGFVLARSYGGTHWNRENLLRYSVGRFARVYPAYLVSLLIIVPVATRYLANPAKGTAAQKATVLASYVFVLQGWSKAVVFWNTPAWSLSCEFFFYLCFPLLALLLHRNRQVMVAVSLVGAVGLPMLMARLGVPDTCKPLTDFADFLLGIGIAAIYDRLARPGSWMLRRGWLLYVPGVAIGAVFVAFPSLVNGWTTLSGALRPLNAALIMGLALGGGFAVRALSRSLIERLGHASYSLYILHVPLMWWFSSIWWRPTGVKLILCSVGYLAGVVIVSAAVFEYVESPTNRRIRAWMNARLS